MPLTSKSSNQRGGKTAQVFERGLFIFQCGLVFLLAQVSNLIFTSNFQQYRFLAESFLMGRLDFMEMPGVSWGDAALFKGTYYWPLGVLPAVLLTPFVFVWQIFGGTFQQGYITFALSLWSIFLVFRLARKLGKVSSDAAWVTLAFVASTSYLAIVLVPWSWHLAHSVAVWLSLIAIHEYLGRQRWAMIGSVVGLVFACRPTASLSGLFFLGALLLEDKRWRAKAANAAFFVSCFVAVLLLVMYYNNLRFGSPFESGYAYQQVLKPDGPLIGPWNILPNLRVFLVGVPIWSERFPFFVADPFGMSIFVVSPWLFLMRPDRWSSLDSLLAASIVVTTVSFLLWWSTGSNQLGYRFSLDFLPFLIWLLLRTNATHVTLPFKMVVIMGGFVNLYFLTTVFNG